MPLAPTVRASNTTAASIRSSCAMSWERGAEGEAQSEGRRTQSLDFGEEDTSVKNRMGTLLST